MSSKELTSSSDEEEKVRLQQKRKKRQILPTKSTKKKADFFDLSQKPIDIDEDFDISSSSSESLELGLNQRRKTKILESDPLNVNLDSTSDQELEVIKPKQDFKRPRSRSRSITPPPLSPSVKPAQVVLDDSEDEELELKTVVSAQNYDLEKKIKVRLKYGDAEVVEEIYLFRSIEALESKAKDFCGSDVVLVFKNVELFTTCLPGLMGIRNNDIISCTKREVYEKLRNQSKLLLDQRLLQVDEDEDEDDLVEDDDGFFIKVKFKDQESISVKGDLIKTVIEKVSKFYKIPSVSLFFDGEKLDSSTSVGDCDIEEDDMLEAK